MAPGAVSQMRFALSRNMAQRALEMPQSMRLADQIGVQRDAHHQRPALAQLQHFVELVDDEIGEGVGIHLARGDRGMSLASCG